MTEIEKFRQKVEDFIAREGWSPSRFGQESANDAKLVFQLRSGREPMTATREKILRFMREYKRGRHDDVTHNP
jgi:hypothetical protein